MNMDYLKRKVIELRGFGRKFLEIGLELGITVK